jgi:hypothetical protein
MFIIYNKATTLILRPNSFHPGYKTTGAANAALTKAVKEKKIAREDFDIAEKQTFFFTIEKQETKKNLLSGKEFQIGVNAPACVDPSTETYHSM